MVTQRGNTVYITIVIPPEDELQPSENLNIILIKLKKLKPLWFKEHQFFIYNLFIQQYSFTELYAKNVIINYNTLFRYIVYSVKMLKEHANLSVRQELLPGILSFFWTWSIEQCWVDNIICYHNYLFLLLLFVTTLRVLTPPRLYRPTASSSSPYVATTITVAALKALYNSPLQLCVPTLTPARPASSSSTPPQRGTPRTLRARTPLPPQLSMRPPPSPPTNSITVFAPKTLVLKRCS